MAMATSRQPISSSRFSKGTMCYDD
jgi:hypothetical protein